MSKSVRMELEVTYGRAADAAYIYLTEIGTGEVDRSIEAVPGTIILDCDRGDKLVGIEIIGARKNVPSGFLELAERID